MVTELRQQTIVILADRSELGVERSQPLVFVVYVAAFGVGGVRR